MMVFIRHVNGRTKTIGIGPALGELWEWLKLRFKLRVDLVTGKGGGGGDSRAHARVLTLAVVTFNCLFYGLLAVLAAIL